ncbi:hypothetical protein Ae263Ps1_6056 [Pseudonocardia sp. Ae263_Ps1]|nr:hypothetical protein Ae263Ps1_6056 [Pseudonocardia sp. Ae263_Ps1]
MAVVATTIVGAATTASAAQGPYMVRTDNAYSAPTFRSSLIGGIFRGTPVTMRCWIDGDWYGTTNRWFLAEGAGFNPYNGRLNFVRGYVSADSVGRQTPNTPHC